MTDLNSFHSFSWHLNRQEGERWAIMSEGYLLRQASHGVWYVHHHERERGKKVELFLIKKSLFSLSLVVSFTPSIFLLPLLFRNEKKLKWKKVKREDTLQTVNILGQYKYRSSSWHSLQDCLSVLCTNSSFQLLSCSRRKREMLFLMLHFILKWKRFHLSLSLVSLCRFSSCTFDCK